MCAPPGCGCVDALRKEWESALPESGSPSLYLAALQHNLKREAQLSKEELGKAQQHQKGIYNWAVKPQAFEVGQKVVITL